MAETMNDRDKAAQRLQDARARFHATLTVARRELTPTTLARRTSARLYHKTKAQVRARPVASAAAGTFLFAILFRKPIAGLFRRLLRTTRHDG